MDTSEAPFGPSSDPVHAQIRPSRNPSGPTIPPSDDDWSSPLPHELLYEVAEDAPYRAAHASPSPPGPRGLIPPHIIAALLDSARPPRPRRTAATFDAWLASGKTPEPQPRKPRQTPEPDPAKEDDPEARPPAHVLLNITLCSATTRRGTPCHFAARRQSGLCINHDPSYKEQQAENSRRGMQASLQRRRDNRSFIPLETLDLSTRGGVQAAIETLLRLELSGRITPARSRNIARTLSLALRNQHQDYEWRNHHAPAYRGAREPALASLPLIARFLAAADTPDPAT